MTKTAETAVDKSAPVEKTVETADSEVTVADLARIVMSLAEEVKDLKSRPVSAAPVTEYPIEMPQAKTPGDILRGMRKGDSRSGTEYFGPPGRRRRFLDNDVVQLVDEEKLKAYVNGGAAAPDKPVYGVILSLMYHKRKTGEPKYKVDFRDETTGRRIVEDGIMESGLSLVQRAR